MVFVINQNKEPMDMVSNAEAGWLLRHHKAAVWRQYPFTIILKTDTGKQERSYTLKLDPGAKTTGMALVDDLDNVCFLAELEHRSEQVRKKLDTRRAVRRNRRQRETRYRHPKWGNSYKKKNSRFSADSPRPEGWLPPSVKSAVDNIETWIQRIQKFCNLTGIIIETVSFDTQKMDNPEIEGKEYQQGELTGYEIREYLLEKYQHTCQYCKGESKDSRLEVEHKHPKSRGGSSKPSNLTLSCHTCNQEKGNRTLKEWKTDLEHKKNPDNMDQAKIRNIEKVIHNQSVGHSDRYCAWVNSSRLNTIEAVKKHCSNVQYSKGYITRYNRTQAQLPKEHYYDALCVLETPDKLNFQTEDVLVIKAVGRGSHFRGRTNSCGIITKNLTREKQHFGFQTGDMVKANVTKGKKIGTYTGKVAVRKTGYFNIQTETGTVEGINYRSCTKIQGADGYSYCLKKRNPERLNLSGKGVMQEKTAFLPEAEASGFPILIFMKVGASIASARRAGTVTVHDEINKFYTISQMPVVSSSYWNNLFGNNAGEAMQDQEGLKVMRQLGRNMAFLIRAIQNQKEKEGLPVQETAPSTNFIR